MPRQRVLHISTIHPTYDPRIVYKYFPTLTGTYEVYCALPRPDAEVAPAVCFIRLPYFRRVLWRFFITGPVVLWKTLRLRPALIHVYSSEFLPFAYVYRLLGAAVIYEVQENLYKKIHLKKQNRGWLLQWAFRFFDRLAWRHFSVIFTEHGYLTTYTQLARPYAVIYNYPVLPFMETFRRPYRKPTDPIEFFYIGLLSFERAIETLLEGLALLKTDYPDFKVHLFGRCMCTQTELESIPAYHNLRENLIFYGYTDQAKALAYAAKSVCGLALLKPVGDYPESYTTKMFEYMALGLPVITANFQLYRDVVEKHQCGFCIDPTDPRVFADRMRYLIEHPQEAAEMGRRGRRATELDYNWQTEGKKLLNLYRKVLPR
ncbi:glycosyltransferase involved in cell wall biosynthesis [Larkinella arboricola]|uniref:Glycosyltransferase involved in cell wall biosynthesis n=1 Tax=Larkinella arboricola TaxID=643671 RepID=A0A327WW73_LARAB|nr:glycosyltransferase [Larkinella arboricola]RAJ97567.1 glycosyltransferase involved in cell wall biosynthesis [Larkinella arboricola]